MADARLETDSAAARRDAVDRLLHASGDDPVFVYRPDGAVATETGDAVAAALDGDGDAVPDHEAGELDLVYEDDSKYRVTVTADGDRYEVRGGFLRRAFDRELATDRYRLRGPDGNCSAHYIVNLMEA